MAARYDSNRHTGLAVISACLTLLVFGVTAPAAMAARPVVSPRAVGPAATITERDLATLPQSVTTSTGKKLKLGISATWDGTSTATFSVQLSKPVKTFPVQYHGWQFTVDQSSFTGSGGSAKLDVTSAQIGWYGRVALTFTPSSHQAESCASGSGTVYKGKLSGSINFSTNQNPKNGWGSVSLPKVSWPQSTITVDMSCLPKIPKKTFMCSIGFTWQSPEVLSGQMAKSFGGSGVHFAGSKPGAGTLSVVRSVTSKINGTFVVRYDTGLELSPLPTLTASGSTASVSVVTGSKSKPPVDTLITGGAELTVTMPVVPKPAPLGSCMDGGKKTTQCSATYSAFSGGKAGSSWTNGKPALTAYMGVGGNVTLGNKSGSGPGVSGSITVDSMGCT